MCRVYCDSRASRDGVKRFFRFPKVIINNDPEKRDEEISSARLKQWFRNINREDLTEEKATPCRVCSNHFITGKNLGNLTCRFFIVSNFQFLCHPETIQKVLYFLMIIRKCELLHRYSNEFYHICSSGEPSKLYDRTNPDWAPVVELVPE